jgi:hypothetical protein
VIGPPQWSGNDRLAVRDTKSVWGRRRAGPAVAARKAAVFATARWTALTTSSRLYGFPINSYRSGRPRRSRAVRVGFVDVTPQARASASCKSQQYAALMSYGAGAGCTRQGHRYGRRHAGQSISPTAAVQMCVVIDRGYMNVRPAGCCVERLASRNPSAGLTGSGALMTSSVCWSQMSSGARLRPRRRPLRRPLRRPPPAD